MNRKTLKTSFPNYSRDIQNIFCSNNMLFTTLPPQVGKWISIIPNLFTRFWILSSTSPL